MPAFSRPFRNVEVEKPLNKETLLREISARTHIREKVVDEVLTTFQEVATEEIVNKGKFNFFGLFSVDFTMVKATQTKFGFSPARKRLKTRLSARVLKLWNGKQREGFDSQLTYSELQERYGDNAKTDDLRSSIGLLPDENPGRPLTGNPLLDDDDEY